MSSRFTFYPPFRLSVALATGIFLSHCWQAVREYLPVLLVLFVIPVFFCLFRVEGEDRVDGIIFTVGADLLRLEHLLIVAQIILQGSEIPTVGTIPDDSQVLPEIMPCPAVILNSGGEKIVLVRLDL